MALIRKLAERMDEESRSDAGVKSGLEFYFELLCIERELVRI